MSDPINALALVFGVTPAPTDAIGSAAGGRGRHSMTTQQITEFRVEKLFGHLTHHLKFRTGTPTLLTGPNGSGKTNILKMIGAIVDLDFRSLFAFRFGELELVYQSGHSLIIVLSKEKGELALTVVGYRSGAKIGQAKVPAASDTPPIRSRDVPPWVERAGPMSWLDRQTDEILTADELRRRYLGRSVRDELLDEYPWLKTFLPLASSTLIETGRLDIEHRPRATRPGRPQRVESEPPPIERYMGQIRRQIVEARGASLSVSQRADRRFAARALDRARATVKESALRARYQRLSDLHHELHANGLTDETIEVTLPAQRMNPTERRILDVFLEDWEDKLRPLQPVHEKLGVLRGIVESKIRGKRLRIDADGDVDFVSSTGDALSVSVLSSGEQHMLALFTMFLFAAQSDSLVLIDEPEISLHAAWKHAFLDDIERVGALIPVQIIMATHSTALINSRWDLVEELRV